MDTTSSDGVVPNDSLVTSGNVAEQINNDGPSPYLLRPRSMMKIVNGTVPSFDTVAIRNGNKNGSEEIVICKILDEFHTGNLELTRLDPCVDDPNHYIAGENDSWIESMHNVIYVHMVYSNEDGKLLLHHPSLSELHSQLGLTGSIMVQEVGSKACIKPGYYVGSNLDVTPLFRKGCFLKINGKKFICLDGIVIPTINPINLTIKSGIYVRIYYENIAGLSKEESLSIPYPVEVLDCLVDASSGKTFCWVRMFERHEDVIGRGDQIPEGVNLHPREVFYTQEAILISSDIIDGIVDVFFTESSIRRWGPTTQLGESFFCRFLATKDGNNTSFQLLSTKGDNEVITGRLSSSREYGRHNALPSHLGISQPHREHNHIIQLISYKVYNHLKSRNTIRSESYVEIPCSDESFMVTFELIAMHSIPPGIVRRNNSLEFIVEGYTNLKEAIFYAWITFPDRFQPTSDSSNQSQPPGKWRVGKTFRFRYLDKSQQPRVFIHFSWDTHQWDPVQNCYGLGMRTGAPHLEL